MSPTTATLTRADDCTVVLKLLGDAGKLSQDDICLKTGWSFRTVNEVLCALVFAGQVGFAKERCQRTRKNVQKYSLKTPGA